MYDTFNNAVTQIVRNWYTPIVSRFLPRTFARGVKIVSAKGETQVLPAFSEPEKPHLHKSEYIIEKYPVGGATTGDPDNMTSASHPSPVNLSTIKLSAETTELKGMHDFSRKFLDLMANADEAWIQKKAEDMVNDIKHKMNFLLATFLAYDNPSHGLGRRGCIARIDTTAAGLTISGTTETAVDFAIKYKTADQVTPWAGTMFLTPGLVVDIYDGAGALQGKAFVVDVKDNKTAIMLGYSGDVTLAASSTFYVFPDSVYAVNKQNVISVLEAIGDPTGTYWTSYMGASNRYNYRRLQGVAVDGGGAAPTVDIVEDLLEKVWRNIHQYDIGRKPTELFVFASTGVYKKIKADLQSKGNLTLQPEKPELRYLFGQSYIQLDGARLYRDDFGLPGNILVLHPEFYRLGWKRQNHDGTADLHIYNPYNNGNVFYAYDPNNENAFRITVIGEVHAHTETPFAFGRIYGLDDPDWTET